MQAYVQAKLGLNESWITIPPNEVLPLSDGNDGDTVSEEAPETRMTIHRVDAPAIEPEERKIRRIEGLRSIEVQCGSSSKKFKYRTVFQGNNVASDADLGARLLSGYLENGSVKAINRHTEETLQDEPSSPMITATTGATSSSYHDVNMDSINLPREHPSAAKRVDSKTIDEQEILRRQLATARDEMHNAVIKYSVASRNYYRNNLTDGLRIIKEDINYILSREEKSTWWTHDPLDDNEI